MDKIYSRRRLHLPKLAVLFSNEKMPDHKQKMKIVKITCIIAVAVITATFMIKSISPILI